MCYSDSFLPCGTITSLRVGWHSDYTVTPSPSMALDPPCQAFAQLKAEQAKLEEQMAALLILPSPTEQVRHTRTQTPRTIARTPAGTGLLLTCLSLALSATHMLELALDRSTSCTRSLRPVTRPSSLSSRRPKAGFPVHSYR